MKYLQWKSSYLHQHWLNKSAIDLFNWQNCNCDAFSLKYTELHPVNRILLANHGAVDHFGQ